MKPKDRIVLYPKDIVNITGKKEWAARKLHAQIRNENNKPNGLVTVEDFCRHTGMSKEEVKEFLN